MIAYQYRKGDPLRRLLYLAQIIGAATLGAGVWIIAVLLFSLGTP